ncbi:hypothetical protein KRMM14A1259_18790 [Krasilnikovia sp. MM14-A1259]
MAAAEPWPPALLALATFVTATPMPRPAAGFELGTAIVRRYHQGSISLVGAAVDSAMGRMRHPAYAILDGTLVQIDRVAD